VYRDPDALTAEERLEIGLPSEDSFERPTPSPLSGDGYEVFPQEGREVGGVVTVRLSPVEMRMLAELAESRYEHMSQSLRFGLYHAYSLYFGGTPQE